jgi:hypothetical protein
MGRTVKRVPLDFAAPVGKIWPGYLNPHSHKATKCAPCDGIGLSPDAKFLSDSWYNHIAREMFGAFYGANIVATWNREKLLRSGWGEEVADNIERARRFGFRTLTFWGDKLDEGDVKALVDGNRLWDLTRDFVPGEGWKDRAVPYVPTPAEVNAWSAQMMGHDSINQWVCVRARCKRYNIDTKCALCDGGEIWPDAESKRLHEEWKEEEPPTGPGWQMWETVTEGSPISPVFDTPEKLANWCAKHATIYGRNKTTAQRWYAMITGKDDLEVGSMLCSGPEGVMTVDEMEHPHERGGKAWTPPVKESGE